MYCNHLYKPLKLKNMKNLILTILSVIVLIGGASLTFTKTKEDKLNGTHQVFVNSFKIIESTRIAKQDSYKERKNDSLVEGFQMYTFDFDSNFVVHDFLWSNDDGDINSYQVKSKITNIEVDGEFVYMTIEDNSNYYSDIKEKIFILNMNNNKNYPVLSTFWKNKGKISGAYSIDNNDFNGFIQESNPDMIFNDRR